MISAKEAADFGLVSRVYPVDELLDKAIELAERISAHSLQALSAAKKAVNAGNTWCSRCIVPIVICCKLV